MSTWSAVHQAANGRVDGGALEVGGRQGGGVVARQDAQEDSLQDVLRVGRVAGDAQGGAKHRLIVAFVERAKPGIMILFVIP